jgi:hypothetical protein
MGLGKPDRDRMVRQRFHGRPTLFVGYRLVALRNVGPYHAGEVWAEPPSSRLPN